MEIFIINGQGGSGKTTFEDFVAEELSDIGMVGVTSMVAYVKQVAEKFGWTGTKELKDRKMLSQLKDLLTEWDDSPFISTCMMIKQMENEGVVCAFIDARSPEDIKRLKDKFNCKTILVTRNKKKHYGNHADDNVFNYDYDIKIDNTGNLEELRAAAKKFADFYFKERC